MAQFWRDKIVKIEPQYKDLHRTRKVRNRRCECCGKVTKVEVE